MPQTSRRTLLKTAVAAMAFPSVIPARALGKDGAIAPSERLTLGVIGFGNRCVHVLGAMLGETDVQCVALCDVRQVRREAGKNTIDNRYGTKDCKTYHDFRELIARPDVDTMLIATGDHWHALAGAMAMQAGKDVYSEKPCAMTIGDCQTLAGIADRYGRVFQAGTQRRSIGNFELAVQVARSGKLGRIHTMYASHYTPRLDYSWLPAEPEPAKEVCDWDLWLGPAPWRPYNSRYVAGGWRGFYDLDSGCTLLDWGAHTVDLCQWANGSDNTTPVEYEPMEDKIVATYANGVKLVMDFLKQPFGDRSPHYQTHLGTCPVRYVGEEGWVETGDAGGIEASPASLKRDINLMRMARRMEGTNPASHGRNFFDCVRSRGLTNANAQVMRHSHIASHVSAIAWLLKRKLKFDPVTESFPGDDEANRLRTRPTRQPWRF